MIPGSNKDHPSFIRSFGYAIEGFVTAVKTERNIKVMLAAGILTVIMGFVAKLQLISWALTLPRWRSAPSPTTRTTRSCHDSGFQ